MSECKRKKGGGREGRKDGRKGGREKGKGERRGREGREERKGGGRQGGREEMLQVHLTDRFRGSILPMGPLEYHLKTAPALGKENAGGLRRHWCEPPFSTPVGSLIGPGSAGARNAARTPYLIWGVSFGAPRGQGGNSPESSELLVAAAARGKLHARMSWVLIAANWS